VAQYRVGQYQQALASLLKADQLNQSEEPADAAFLAMTQHCLKQPEQAQVTLTRRREMVQKSQRRESDEVNAFLREAEERIEGKSSGTKK
jgi:hypothetical protein